MPIKRQQAIPEMILIGLGYSVGSVSLATLPIWLAAIMSRYQLTSSGAGIIVSLELGCLAGTSVLAAAIDLRSSRARLMLAVAGSVVVNLLSAYAPDIVMLAILRTAAGICNGLVLVTVTRAASKKPQPAKYFSAQLFTLVACAVVFFSAIQFMTVRFGPGASFLIYSGFGAVALGFVGNFRPSADGTSPDAGADVVSWGAIGIILTGVALTFCLQSALWAYLLPAGQAVGVSSLSLGRVLGVGAIANLLAPLLSTWLSSRWDTTHSLLLGYTGLALSLIAVGAQGNAWIFIVGAIGINFFLMLLAIFMLSALSAQEPTGRASALGPAFFMIGAAIGPSLGGVILDHSGMTVLAWSTVIAAGLAAALVLLGARSAPQALRQLAPGVGARKAAIKKI